MRTPIERLAFELSRGIPGNATLGELAKHYGETTERIMDAIDVLKIRKGLPTTFPAIDWGDGFGPSYPEPSKDAIDRIVNAWPEPTKLQVVDTRPQGPPSDEPDLPEIDRDFRRSVDASYARRLEWLSPEAPQTKAP
jgi:hypothetical protein